MPAPIRVIYGCPAINVPTGGIKVIYKQCELLKSLGVQSYIWHPSSPDFRCTWFVNQVQTIDQHQFNTATDFIILPEIWVGTSVFGALKSMGFKVGVYVQNAYLTHVKHDESPKRLAENLLEADLVLSISKDTTNYLKNILQVSEIKIVPQRLSVNHEMFQSQQKLKLMTYMPRKLTQHSIRVASALKPLLPHDWHILPIDNMSENNVADLLAKSIIFLSFSEFEGLGLPPVEAALAANYVIGYHGEGGREYWQAPNFTQVNQGDIQSFVKSVLNKVQLLEEDSNHSNELLLGIKRLRDYFSPAQEIQFLGELIKSIQLIFENSSETSLYVPI